MHNHGFISVKYLAFSDHISDFLHLAAVIYFVNFAMSVISPYDWTAAIVFLQVSAANCYKGCRWSRMLPLVLSQEPEDQSIWCLFYAIFTGCRFDSGSRLRQQFWSTSVCTTWLHSTFRCIASRHQQSPAGVFDPLTPADWLFHAPEQTTATAASLSKELRCPRTSCVEQSSCWTSYTRHHAGDVQKQTWDIPVLRICNCYPAHLQLLPNLALYKCS